MAKELMMMKDITVKDLAKEFEVLEEGLENWMKTGYKSKHDPAKYEELVKEWILEQHHRLNSGEIYTLINKFNRSSVHEFIQTHPTAKQDPAEYTVDSILIDNRYPLKKLKTEINSRPPTTNHLIQIPINIKDDRVQLKETLMWNMGDDQICVIHQFSKTLIQDHIIENNLKLNFNQQKGYIDKVAKMILEQVNMNKELEKNSDIVARLNTNAIQEPEQSECLMKIRLNFIEEGYQIIDTFDWEVDPLKNNPEVFAKQYVEDNNLPNTLTMYIASQIRRQINEYIKKRVRDFKKMFSDRFHQSDQSLMPDASKTNLQQFALRSLNNNTEAFNLSLKFEKEHFLKNTELFSLMNRYTDYLSPAHKYIFLNQKSIEDLTGLFKKSQLEKLEEEKQKEKEKHEKDKDKNNTSTSKKSKKENKSEKIIKKSKEKGKQEKDTSDKDPEIKNILAKKDKKPKESISQPIKLKKTQNLKQTKSKASTKAKEVKEELPIKPPKDANHHVTARQVALMKNKMSQQTENEKQDIDDVSPYARVYKLPSRALTLAKNKPQPDSQSEEKNLDLHDDFQPKKGPELTEKQSELQDDDDDDRGKEHSTENQMLDEQQEQK